MALRLTNDTPGIKDSKGTLCPLKAHKIEISSLFYTTPDFCCASLDCYADKFRDIHQAVRFLWHSHFKQQMAMSLGREKRGSAVSEQ